LFAKAHNLLLAGGVLATSSFCGTFASEGIECLGNAAMVQRLAVQHSLARRLGWLARSSDSLQAAVVHQFQALLAACDGYARRDVLHTDTIRYSVPFV
jgi:hypothetical protein